MTYLIQVSTCWIIFFGIYLLFLRRETFFSINRYYLLGALLVGLLVPYLGAFIPANEASVEVYQVMTQFTVAEVAPQAYIEDAQPIFTWMNMLWTVYILGGLIVLSRFLFGLNKINSIYKEADKTPQANYILVESEKYHLPFSFFHFIFISKQLPLNEEVEKVLRHEELHANQWHSMDIVFTELLQIFFWFNPILIFYKNALRQSHEYLADAYVTQDYNKNSYGQLLLQQSTSGLEIALANQFFHSQIKKRITMMYQEKSKRTAMVKYLAAVPVLVAMLIIFSSNQKQTNSNIELLKLDKEQIEIWVLDNGAYTIEQTPVSFEDIETLLSNDHPKTTSIDVISFGNNNAEKANDLLELAKKHKIKTDSNEHSFTTNNFDNRKIIKRDFSLWTKYKCIEGVIAVKADADVEGNIIFAEIENTKTTIDNKEVLKTALKAVKGFKIEKGSNNTFGEIIFNLALAKPTQGHIFKNGTDKFIFENEISLGEQVPEGSVEVKIKDNLLKENEDYTINYATGKLTLNQSYDGKAPVNVTFKENSEIDDSSSILDLMDDFTKDNGDPVFKVADYEDIERTAKQKENTIPGIKIKQNTPNPWRQTTTIKVNTEKTKTAVLSIYNVPGEVVYSKTVQLEKGDNFFRINRKDVGNKYGVFYYQLTVGNKNHTMKMVLIDGEEDPIFKVVEEMPRFPGCEDLDGNAREKEDCAKQKMLEFVYSNLKYPAKARSTNVEGMCVVQFVIEKDGSVSDTKIVRDIGADCGTETLNVVNAFPTWIPGKQKGKAVRVQYTLPVKFKLAGDEKEEKKKSKGFEIQESKFRGITNIHQLIKNMPELNGSSIKSFDIVFIRPESDAYIFKNNGEDFTDDLIAKVKEVKEGDRVFIEKLMSVSTTNDVVESAGVFYTVVADNISTDLEGKTTGVDITKGSISNIVLKSTNNKGPQPLIVIDGKIKPEGSIENIAPDDIESIKVLKGEKATNKYGDKGTNGVLEITMKVKKSPTQYFIDGHLFDYDFYKTIEKSHIHNEGPASMEDKFMTGIKDELISVSMGDGYGYKSACFPGTNTEDDSKLSLMNFVGNNIKYPKSAIDNEIEGIVTVRYTVESDGLLSNFKIGRSLGWGLDEAVLEMMENLADEKGLWKAAYLDKRPIASSMVLPVKFKLQSDQKKEAKSRKLNTIKFAVSPNPSDGKFKVEYRLDKNIPASLIFYSIEGKILKKMLNLPAENKLTVDLSGQSLSVIYISLEQDGKVKTVKATVQK